MTKWHKRLGLVSAVFVLLLSFTGILLNHTSALHLGKTFVSAPWVLSVYSVESPNIRAFAMNENFVSQAGKAIYFDNQRVWVCDGSLQGALIADDYWVALCSESLALFSFDNVLIETIDVTYGLPVPILRVARCGEGVCIKTKNQALALDFDSLAWTPIDDLGLVWLIPSQAPEALRRDISLQAKQRVITLEKVVLDLHAGRFLGGLGPFIMDVVAICFCLLAGTGIYMWSRKRNKRS